MEFIKAKSCPKLYLAKKENHEANTSSTYRTICRKNCYCNECKWDPFENCRSIILFHSRESQQVTKVDDFYMLSLLLLF